MFVINVFGLGVIYYVLELPIDVAARFEEIAKISKVDFSDVFFDFELIEQCGFSNFTELPRQQAGMGCVIEESNTLEIRNKRKKINQFSLFDLWSQDYLFPMYQTKIREWNYSKKEGYEYFFLYQVIKGRLVKYPMETFIGMDELMFEIQSFEIQQKTFQFMTGIYQNGIQLDSEKDDSLVVEQNVLRI
jgi:hypothetical protein